MIQKKRPKNIFWDGIREISSTADKLYLNTAKWIHKLQNSNQPVYIHIITTSSADQSILRQHPLVLSFSYMGKALKVLTVYISQPYTSLLFVSPLFSRLRSILLDSNRQRIFATKNTAMESHMIFLRVFKMNLPNLYFINDDGETWTRTFINGSAARLINIWINDFFPYNSVDEEMVNAVQYLKYSLSQSNSLDLGDQVKLNSFIILLHGAMIRKVDSISTQPYKSIATGNY